MPNSNYIAGRKFEYEVRDYLKERGYIVIRASGSHSPFDLVAIRYDQILLLQCKLCSNESGRKRIVKRFLSNPPIKEALTCPGHQGIASRIKGDTTISFNYVY